MKRENYQKAGEKEEANIPQHSTPTPKECITVIYRTQRQTANEYNSFTSLTGLILQEYWLSPPPHSADPTFTHTHRAGRAHAHVYKEVYPSCMYTMTYYTIHPHSLTL